MRMVLIGPRSTPRSRTWRCPSLRLVRLHGAGGRHRRPAACVDRGETKDWFGSTEIVVEALIAACGFYLFLVHLLTAERRFTPSSATAASPPARS